jgi:energy-coupling factor transporter ATP-binding protein EcfA2
MKPYDGLTSEAVAVVDEYRRLRVGHPFLEQATAEVRMFLANPVAKPICLLIGPAGVGKSTLVEHTAASIHAERANELALHRERVAVLTTSVPSGHKVSLRPFYEMLLSQLGAVLPDRKIDPELNRQGLRHVTHVMTEADARIGLLAELRRRQPSAIIFDEADHLVRGRGEIQRLALLDEFKYLTIETGLPLLLVGTYALLEFCGLAPPFDRRMRQIHLRAYDYGRKDERRTFQWAVRQLANRLPVPQPELAEDIEAIYERTLGCIGSVHEWFLLALVAALADGSDRIGPRHLEAHRPTIAAAARAHTVMTDGAKQLTDSKEGLRKLRGELGLPSGRSSTTRTAARRPVGRRNANRDKVSNE